MNESVNVGLALKDMKPYMHGSIYQHWFHIYCINCGHLHFELYIQDEVPCFITSKCLKSLSTLFYKIGVPKLNTIWTPTFECAMWLQGNLRTTNKKTCLKEIGLYDQNMPTILGSIYSQHDWGGPHDHVMSMRILTLIVNKILIWTPIFLSEMVVGTIWIFYSSHTNCVFRTLQEVGAERKAST
jgi:hypothetical protein